MPAANKSREQKLEDHGSCAHLVSDQGQVCVTKIVMKMVGVFTRERKGIGSWDLNNKGKA